MSDQFATPGTASGISWEDLNGALLLIEPLSLEEGIQTSFGEKSAIRAKVAVLDGDHASDEHSDTLIFPLVLQGQLRSRMGAKVLGRLGQGEKKAGQKPPWKLAEATIEDEKVGLEYLANGFATPAAASNEAPF